MNNLATYLLSIIVLLSISSTAKTQDIIYKNDGSKIEAKIVKIAQDVVKYKKYSDIEGTIFLMEISEITMIRYESGKNVFLTKAFTDVKKEVKEFKLEKNLITFHLFDIIFDDFPAGAIVTDSILYSPRAEIYYYYDPTKENDILIFDEFY